MRPSEAPKMQPMRTDLFLLPHGERLRIAVASGKGGTGKTTVSVNLAALFADAGIETTYADCDVEAPNGRIFFSPTDETAVPVTVPVPDVDAVRCTLCGACGEACRFTALAVLPNQVLTFPKLCHGCGGCLRACPSGAIREVPRAVGVLSTGNAGKIRFLEGRLNVGETMAPPVIRAVIDGLPEGGVQILDAPPGTACPVVETVKAADVTVLVTEPTAFGLHDLRLAVDMMRAVGRRFGVVINRAGIGDDRVERYCEAEEIQILGHLDNDRRIAEAYSRGIRAATVSAAWTARLAEIARRIFSLAAEPEGLREKRMPLKAPSVLSAVERAPEPYRETPNVTELTIISGKGGTGKTAVSASFAALAGNAAIADCDVDAADLHLILSPGIVAGGPFSGGYHGAVDTERCTGCGLCETVCRFGAVSAPSKGEKTPRIDPLSCEGCGVCADACPEKAVQLERTLNGEWFVSNTRLGPMAHARLGAAAENSGKLVSLVRKKGKEITADGERDFLICDGSPGIGCPVVASLVGVSGALIVTEPTLSGLHDMERVGTLCTELGVRAAVCVNKADINPNTALRIEERAAELGISSLGRIRYDDRVTAAQAAEKSVVEYEDGPAAEDIRQLWKRVVRTYFADKPIGTSKSEKNL